MKTKSELLDRARRQLDDVRQYFNDVNHWNRVNPKDFIDPDPDGSVTRMAHGLERFIHTNTVVIDV